MSVPRSPAAATAGPHPQLGLSIQLPAHPDFSNYVAGPNRLPVESLRGLGGPAAAADAVLLYGAAGVGKTHLLQALARAQAVDAPALYLPLRSLRTAGSTALASLTPARLVILDDIDSIADDREWTLALLRLLDALRSNGARYAASSRLPAERLPDLLPDLRTRLQAALELPLKPLSDADRLQLLQQAAQQRGMHLADDAASWILNHLDRNNASLIAAIDTLDRASLAAKRRLTLPFVQQTLS